MIYKKSVDFMGFSSTTLWNKKVHFFARRAAIQEGSLSGKPHKKQTKPWSLHRMIYPLPLKLSRLKIKTQLMIKREEPAPMGPVIYAANHSNSRDVPLALRAIGHHCKVLVGKQSLYFSDRLFFLLNGTIWVDRKDKADMVRAKEKILRHLSGGHSLLWFPEGTWNLTDNLLMLPMRWGIIDCAKKAKVPIVPMILEYSEDKRECTVVFGKALDPANMSLSEGIARLRDQMGEMRWQLWEEKGMQSRMDIDSETERKKLFQAVKEYPPLDWEYEESIIFRPTN